MESPIPLVLNPLDGKLSVHPPAVDLLKTIDQPLVVVAMIGKYRTGKSYLLNCLAGKRKMFAHLLDTSIELFRQGELACLDSVVQSLTDTENEKTLKEAEKLYEEQMEKLVSLPIETAKDLNKAHEKCNQEAFDMFLKWAFGNSESYKDKLQKTMEGIFDGYCKRNKEESSKKCKGLLEELFQEIDVKFKANAYAVPGGYSQDLKDQNLAINHYNQTSRSEAEKDRQAQMELQKAAMEQQMQMMKDIMASVTQSNEKNMEQFMQMNPK
ncbi:hypothetical protein chiPu_0015315 [Chiloscyllium punctatum]|uniref:Guanylate-binding protein/Atlastin C-terminal domain-containing protein n=1 Tax=Chiloscyllium punctatum TaxID=137246 RepID=A0A401T2C7_CHIPU|nr:hypothetical protein [Chiloscyllium punctatum]